MCLLCGEVLDSYQLFSLRLVSIFSFITSSSPSSQYRMCHIDIQSFTSSSHPLCIQKKKNYIPPFSTLYTITLYHVPLSFYSLTPIQCYPLSVPRPLHCTLAWTDKLHLQVHKGEHNGAMLFLYMF